MMSIQTNSLRPQMPYGFTMTTRGLFQDQEGDKGARYICSPFEVLAQTLSLIHI